MGNKIDLTDMKDIIELKLNNPKEYKKYLKAFEEVSRDMIKIVNKLGNEMVDTEEESDEDSEEDQTYY